MNPKNPLINNFAKESIARQEKILEKTSQIKAHANLLQAKEKKQMRMTGMKLMPLSSRDGPRSKEKCPVPSDPPQSLSLVQDKVKLGLTASEPKDPDPECPEEEQKIPDTIKVNPKIDLSLLFFDEERPDWSLD